MDSSKGSASIVTRLARAFFFSNPDDALAAELARNEEARTRVATTKFDYKKEQLEYQEKMDALDESVRLQREAYAKQAKPLLAEFDDIDLSQHYYQELQGSVTAQYSMMGQLSQRETHQYGYMSKQLISVGLKFEALAKQIRSGKPFAAELNAMLDDADSNDLDLMAAPLQSFAGHGIPARAVVRASAFEVARAMEETGKAPAQAATRGWIDLLKFRNAISPSTAESNQARARVNAATFLRHIEADEFPQALKVADEVLHTVQSEKDAQADAFTGVYNGFRQSAIPAVAADVFLAYTKASLDASRYACVESVLKE